MQSKMRLCPKNCVSVEVNFECQKAKLGIEVKLNAPGKNIQRAPTNQTERPIIMDKLESSQNKSDAVFCKEGNEREIMDIAKNVCEKLSAIGFKSKILKMADLSEVNVESCLLTNDEKFALRSSSSFLKAFIVGSLSSSCCLIQLGLNMLSSFNILHVGCAGFNKVLGPLRPYARFLTMLWLLMLWLNGVKGSDHSKERRKNFFKRSRTYTLVAVLTLTLTFLPEILLYGGGPAIAPPVDGMERKVYTIDNMGCEACVDGVERILAQHPGVLYGRLLIFLRVMLKYTLQEKCLDGQNLLKQI